MELANLNGLCTLCFLHIQIMYKYIQNYIANKLTETVFVCFLYIQTMYELCKIYANVNRIKYAPADVCFMYTTPLHSLLFEFLHQ